MKKLILLLTIISAAGCAQSGYRYADDYGDHPRYGRYASDDDYGYSRYRYTGHDRYSDYADDYYADDDIDIDLDINLNWNAFPDRYGIAYGAVINGPYRYPRVGFYYRNSWYPSAWWGSYAYFDPWYSDYYYRHRGSYLSLSFNFYDFDDDWYDPWFDAGWGYGLAYNWFRPSYGWNSWGNHHHYRPWSGYWGGYHNNHDSGWRMGRHFTPVYRGGFGDYNSHRRSDHIDTRSEAARLAARRPGYRSSNYRTNRYQQHDGGRVYGNIDNHQRQDNPRNVVTRQHKRPAQRQRSVYSSNRYNRVPASSRPFDAGHGTVVRRNASRPTQSTTNRLTGNHSRLPLPAGNSRTHSTRRYANRAPANMNRHIDRATKPAQSVSPRQHNKPLVRNISRYRAQPVKKPQSRPPRVGSGFGHNRNHQAATRPVRRTHGSRQITAPTTTPRPAPLNRQRPQVPVIHHSSRPVSRPKPASRPAPKPQKSRHSAREELQHRNRH